MRHNKENNKSAFEMEDIVFSLEKIEPTPTPTSEGPPQPTPTPTPTPAEECPGSPFASSITTQLGANSQVPELYYGESVGISIVSVSLMTIGYGNLNNSGPPFNMDIQIGGQVVAVATPWVGYLGNPFEIEYLGFKYCGQFVSGTVSFP